MTIWIDPPAWPAHGRLWSHLVSDLSYDELHAFASAQGLPRRAFEGDHYDIPEERYAALVASGARPVGSRDLVRILRASGLRIQKRKHEKVIRSTPNASWLPAGGRADVIASRQPDAPATTVVVRLALLRRSDLLLVPAPDGGFDLPSAAVLQDGPAAAVLRLSRGLLDSDGGQAPVLLGYVRNSVPEPDPDYPWPVPQASFAVYRQRLASAADAAVGVWLGADAAAHELSAQPWSPLLAHLDDLPA